MLFNEQDHTYTENGKKYRSVSEVIKQFIPKFEKEAIAKRMNGQSTLDEWELNAEISTHYGTSIHKGLEYFIKFGKFTKLPHVEKAVKAFAEKYDRTTIKSEIIIHDDELLVSGTIDDLQIIGYKRVNIIDLKTNYELGKAGRGKLLGPFNHLEDSKINKYRLQLSTYKELVERKGIIVENLLLEHWNGETLETIKLEPLKVLQYVR